MCECECDSVGFCLDVVSEVSCELVVVGVAVVGVFSSLGDERDLDGVLGRLCWVSGVSVCGFGGCVHGFDGDVAAVWVRACVFMVFCVMDMTLSVGECSGCVCVLVCLRLLGGCFWVFVDGKRASMRPGLDLMLSGSFFMGTAVLRVRLAWLFTGEALGASSDLPRLKPEVFAMFLGNWAAITGSRRGGESENWRVGIMGEDFLTAFCWLA